METLETLARRIEVTTSLRSVVRTMKTLSLVKIRQFEHAQRSIGVYARAVELGLQAVLMDEPPAPPGPRSVAGPVGIVIIGSDYGLCGRFNEDIVRVAHARLRQLGYRSTDVPQLAVGHRVAARLESTANAPEDVIAVPGTVPAITATTDAALIAIDEWRRSRGVARVLLFHNAQSESAAAEPREVGLLPVARDWLRSLAARPWPARGRPMHTMEGSALLALLLRQHLFVQVYRTIAHSLVSEHASRLAVMQSAESNISDRLEEMSNDYRRVRQDSITAELLDAIGGYEAMRRRS